MQRLRALGSVSLFMFIGGVILFLVLMSFFSQFYYLFSPVNEQEVGIQFRNNQLYNIVGPGVYSDFGFFVDLQTISTQAIPFSVRDEEIITKDKQRLGVVVSGDIFRPNVSQKDIIQKLWSQYRLVYVDDELASNRVSDLARQSMKVCVGERTFDDNIIGNARDALRSCIDEELSELARNYGLDVQNVVVPEVILSPAVQTALEAIVQSRLETEKAAQDALKANAQAKAEQVKQEGQIRVEQSRIQEQAKQQTTLAKLEQEKIQAQKVVIEAERANELAKVEAEKAIIQAQKNNELLAAQQDLAINKALAEAAVEKAKADFANQTILAELYATNPEYWQLQLAKTNADALKATDKIIFTQEGTIPNLVFTGSGILPTLNAQPLINPTPPITQ